MINQIAFPKIIKIKFITFVEIPVRLFVFQPA